MLREVARQLVTLFAVFSFCVISISGQAANGLSVPLPTQYDLSTDGRAFLLNEASRASFFMLGELHGENEIPALIRNLWPSMWEVGYRHVAAEISPWAANRLEFGKRDAPIVGLWTQPEATFVTSLKRDRVPVLWGCDIEELQPHLLIRELAAANPNDKNLRMAVDAVKNGYQRKMAPALLQLVKAATVVKDPSIGGVSLRNNLVRSLDVETDRFTGARLSASLHREAIMKDLFHDYWLKAGKTKVFLRLGRNHLHRGIDRRGVSTLGNFVAELGAAYHLRVFNVAAFAGGGKIRLLAPPSEFDERGDDPAFAFLASIARYPATVFDLRPLREALLRIPETKRSPIEASLVYWVDSYDAMIFYREVTPLGSSQFDAEQIAGREPQ
jgi:hypothetical protein